MSNEKQQQVEKLLDDLKIRYEVFSHPAVYTVAQADQFQLKINATHCKNLFLRNKKKTKYYLLIARSDANIDFKKLAFQLGESRISFASNQDLDEILHTESGSVSPFALINNTSHSVIVVLDKSLVQSEKVGFHPNVNTATFVLKYEDFLKFLESTDNKIVILSF